MKKIILPLSRIGMIYAFGLAARAEEAAPSAAAEPSWKSKGVKPPPP